MPQTHTTPAKPTAIVIGAGVAGLATAGLLARDGYDVTVFEKQHQVGGRAGVIEDAGFRWDMGPSWWLMPGAFEHFYKLMGTTVEEELELVHLNEPAFRMFTEDHPPLDVTTGTQNLLELFERLEPGAGQKVQQYLAGMETDYRLAIEQFLYTNFTELRGLTTAQILRRLGRLARKLTQSIESDVAAHFDHVQLRQLLTYAAVFLSSAPKITPAFYGIMNYTTLIEGVAYPMGGFGTFVDSLHRLAVDAGAQIVTGATVERIHAQANGHPRRHVSSVTYRDATGTHQQTADIVVSCADRQHTEAQLVDDQRAARPKYWKRRNPGLSSVLAYLGIEGELPELAHHSLFFSQDWDPDFTAVFPNDRTKASTDRSTFSRSLYVSRPSATDPSVAPQGHENVFLLIPVPAMDDGIVGDLNHPEDAETTAIVDQAIELVGQRIGVPNLADRIVARHTVGPGDFQDRFNAWQGNALGLAHTLAQSAFFRGANTSKHVDGLYFAGATTVPGVGLPMCLISAENVIKRLRNDTTTGPIPTPLQPTAARIAHNR
ncbi:phytoene desaturase [Enteractinococcus fodinae]|uniref:Phytoene desaturase n=1 Tax=Enteractinococcus fodinae TaxID=684663 RepID=A0ABU2B3N0_9MICC|nr:phytoene desaturase family protein [Enteractinococcus fodinae]MDR7348202.1 phytoene desaturase [Enteractinococcus fodinae]